VSPVAIVTGGSGGVGRGITLALARAGFVVGVNHFDTPDPARETVDQVATLGGQAWAVHADVRVPADVQAMVADAVTRYGRLDVFVNNAGVQTWKPLLAVTEDEWDLVIDTNLKGCFLGTQAAARVMKDHGGGVIINIGSGCNKIGFPKLVAYTASKGGIEMLTKVSAVELGPHNIRVNCVAPGAVENERTRHELPDYAGTFAKMTPLGRVGLPEDVGRVVAYLASDEASFVTGQTIWVDGGLFSQPPWAHT
jgi:3-oxoacyl-[acyl-carrier protein] reductase